MSEYLKFPFAEMSAKNKLRIHNRIPRALASAVDMCNAYIAGGAIRSCFDNTQIRDYDIFFKHYQDRNKMQEIFSAYKAKMIYQSMDGTLTSYSFFGYKVQLVEIDVYDTAEELLKTFDFTAAMFCIDKEALYTTYEALRDAKKKLLVMNDLTNPYTTVKRIVKYTDKGYTFSQELIQEFCRLAKEKEKSLVWSSYES